VKRGDLSLMVVSSTTPLLRHLSGVVRRFQAFSRNGYRALQRSLGGVKCWESLVIPTFPTGLCERLLIRWSWVRVPAGALEKTFSRSSFCLPRHHRLTPSYLKHMQTGRGRLVWTDHTGTRHERLLPGAFGSPESLQAKAALELEIATSPIRAPAACRPAISVNGLLHGAGTHARAPIAKPAAATPCRPDGMCSPADCQ